MITISRILLMINGRMSILLIGAVIALTTPAFALHPLITDDTGTQGKGKFELEFGFQHDHDIYNTTSSDQDDMVYNFYSLPIVGTVTIRSHYQNNINQMTVTLSYGIIDKLDVIIGIPYQVIRSKEKSWLYTGTDPFRFLQWDSNTSANGLSDVNVGFKWNFYEYKILSLAFKPGMLFPSGNPDSGLGAGGFGGYIYFITTLDMAPVEMHLNLGYIRNQNIVEQQSNIWHASLAFEFWLVKHYLRLTANTGFERNRNTASRVQDVFVLGGIIVSPTLNCDMDLGFRASLAPKGIESPGPDYSLLGGLTIRFGSGNSGEKGGEKK